MQPRYRVPTIFSIYMLDVICCALGCVVLLWQTAHQEAEDQTAKAQQEALSARQTLARFQEEHRKFLSASQDVVQLQTLLELLEKKERSVSSSLAHTEKEREEARKLAARRLSEIENKSQALMLSQQQLKKLEEDLARLLIANRDTIAKLTGQEKTIAELRDKIGAAEKQIAALRTDVSAKQLELDLTNKKWQEQVVLVKLSEDNARKLQKLLDSLRDENKNTQSKLKLSSLQLKVRDQEFERLRDELKALLGSREKLDKAMTAGAQELLDAKVLLATLTAERNAFKQKLDASTKDLASADLDKKKLNQRVLELQAEVEQRFAGVPLTGENVVFLIDVSGSMTMKDSKTDDPDKWPFLCDTLMRLMGSIPEMQRFQVILFSDKTSYLFGERDFWLRYKGPETAKATRDALVKFKVGGGTNMHDGFDEAFRYRKMGLDTIYLFSDGLPNIGPGLPAGIKDPTEEQLNLHLGKFLRDKLRKDWNRPVANKETGPVRINAIGFYFESPDVGAFLWAMSREHRGSFVGLR